MDINKNIMSVGGFLALVTMLILPAHAQTQNAIGETGQGEVGQNEEALNNKGQECFDGTCDGCDRDCSLTTSRRSCYQCCIDNCLGDGATSCQGICDDHIDDLLRRMIGAPSDQVVTNLEMSSNFLNQCRETLNTGGTLSHDQVQVAEWLSVAADNPAIRRLAFAIIIDAYARGNVTEQSKPLIEDALQTALTYPDLFIRTTAFHMVEEFDLRQFVTNDVIRNVVDTLRGSSQHLHDEIRRWKPNADDETINRWVNSYNEDARDFLMYVF